MKRIWLLVVIASIAIGLQGCGNAKVERSEDLVVVEQTDTVRRGQDGDIYC